MGWPKYYELLGEIDVDEEKLAAWSSVVTTPLPWQRLTDGCMTLPGLAS